MYFILSDNGNYDFDVKVRRCGLVGFVKNVIDNVCLSCVFCFKIKGKRKTHFISNFILQYAYQKLLFYNISPKLFLYFSLYELNNYNGYVCAIYNCFFL